MIFWLAMPNQKIFLQMMSKTARTAADLPRLAGLRATSNLVKEGPPGGQRGHKARFQIPILASTIPSPTVPGAGQWWVQ